MRTLLVVLLLSCVALAQTATPPSRPAAPTVSPAQAPPKSGAQAAPAPEPKEVPPTAAVITIDGFCASSSSTPAAQCKTVVTRAEFDKLADALNPQMPAPTRMQLANAYWRMLVMARAAGQLGLESKPDTQEILRFSRLQALSQILLRNLQQQASNVPAADVEKYYNEHKTQYVQANLQRIFIPKAPQGAQPADVAKLKAEADKIHAAAVSGGDPEQLQKQAYTDLDLKSTPPPVAVNNTRRDNLPPGQAQAFDLEPGQVSAVMDEPGGFYIYKLVSRNTLSLADVEQEIKRNLSQERFQQEVENITKGVKPEFNQAFFGSGEAMPEGRPRMPPASGLTPRAGAAPAVPAKPAAPPAKPAPKTPPKP